MADDKKPTTTPKGSVVEAPPAKVLAFQSKVELPNIPVVMTDEQFRRFQHSLTVGFVTMGYMANGGRPTTPARVRELQDLIETVEEL